MKMKLQVLTILLGAALGAACVDGQVNTATLDNQVVVVGSQWISAMNRPFVAFQGIPYAESPVGDLRFRAPRKNSLPQLVDARSTRLPCPGTKATAYDSEDCLYLDVYTPQMLNKTARFPVLVMLNRGFSGRWMPHRIVDRNIVLVVVQARQGALGFLYDEYDNELAPGNMGLLDERMALHWVQDNIHSFCGDKSRVTLGGIREGAVSAQIHLINPFSYGLFQKVISISGSALSPMALGTNALNNLALTTGCANYHPPVKPDWYKPTGSTPAVSDSESITTKSSPRVRNKSADLEHRLAAWEKITCLKSLSLPTLLNGTYVSSRFTMQAANQLIPTGTVFGPIVEKNNTRHRALPDVPYKQWDVRTGSQIPLLAGISRTEGLDIVNYNNATLVEYINQHWKEMAPIALKFDKASEANRNTAADAIQKQYRDIFKYGSPDYIAHAVADRHVVVPTLEALAIHHNFAKASSYLYRFSWNDNSTWVSRVSQRSKSGANSIYAGPEGGRDAVIVLMQPQSNDELRAMAADLLDVWTSFIYTGTPKIGHTSFKEILYEKETDFVDITGPGQHTSQKYPSSSKLRLFWKKLPIHETSVLSMRNRFNRYGIKSSSNNLEATKWSYLTSLLVLLAYSFIY